MAWSLGGAVVLVAVLAASESVPFRPVDDTLVLGPAAAGAHAAVAALGALDAGDRDAVVAFARAALGRAEVQQDPREASYGLIAIQRHHAVAGDVDTRMLEATLLQRLHRFDEAMAVLDDVLATPDPPAQAHFVRSILWTLRGDYRRALADCAAMLDRTDAITVAACAAIPNSRSGRADATWTALAAMLDEPAAARSPLLGYARGVKAELAWRLQRPDALDRLAAWSAEGSVLARIVHADALLDHGDAAAALRLLETTPGESALVRRARALRMLGNDADALASLTATHATMRASRALRSDASHAREEAYWDLHVADDPLAALALARENWALQREPIDAELVLDAALRAGRPEAAAPVLEWLERHAIDDARLLARRRAFTERTRA